LVSVCESSNDGENAMSDALSDIARGTYYAGEPGRERTTKPKIILKCPKCMWQKSISSYSGDTYGGIEICEKCGERIAISPKNWTVLR